MLKLDRTMWVPLGLFALSVYFFVSGVGNFLGGSEKASYFGLEVLTTTGLVSFRVVYGGMMCGIALTLLCATFYRPMWFFGLVLAQCVISSFLVFRVLALISAEEMIDAQMVLVAAEVVEVALISGLMWLCLRKG